MPKSINAQIILAKDLKEDDHGDTKTTKIISTDILSLAKIRKVGDDIKLGHDTESDVIYYVIDGEGDCVIAGKKHHLQKGDCVAYPKGTNYKHLKGLTLLAISTPPFDRKKRVYVE